MLPGYMMGNTHQIRGASETEGGGYKKSDPGGLSWEGPQAESVCNGGGLTASLWARLGMGQHSPELEGKEGRGRIRCRQVGRKERRLVEAQNSRPCDCSAW